MYSLNINSVAFIYNFDGFVNNNEVIELLRRYNMYIIFYGTGRSLAASLLAYLYLNTSPSTYEIPELNPDEIISLGSYEKKAIGRLHFMGEDSYHNKVYILNTAAHETIILPALASVFDLLQVDKSNLLLVDTTTIDSTLQILAVSFLRLSLLRDLGVRLIINGINKNKKAIIRILEKTYIKSK